MPHNDHHVHVFINQLRHLFEQREQTGRAIKERAAIPLDHVLCLEVGHHDPHDECGCERKRPGAELKMIDDGQLVSLENGQHFWSHALAAHGVVVTINRKEYEFADPHQTGRSLKERAGIPLTDVLFLDRPHEDEVIADDARVSLKCGECFHSAPPANYGSPALDAAGVGFDQFDVLPQPDSWTFLVINHYPLPDAFSPNVVRLLVKLPPSFPDGAPDMFWLNPQVRTATGGAPQGTSVEAVLGEQWQRFSWHLLPGAWRPGTSTLRDYMRCVRARLEKGN
jgi:hypothetical protein